MTDLKTLEEQYGQDPCCKNNLAILREKVRLLNIQIEDRTFSDWESLFSVGDEDQKREASWALKSYGLASLPTFVELMERGDPLTRWWSIESLKDYGVKACSAVGPLESVLVREEDEDVIFSAIEALGEIGSKAARALPKITNHLFEEGYTTTALRAIQSIGDKICLTEDDFNKLSALSSHEDAHIRRTLPGVIALCSNKESALKILTNLLNDKDKYVIGRTLQALVNLGKEGQALLLNYARNAEDKDEIIKGFLEEALDVLKHRETS